MENFIAELEELASKHAWCDQDNFSVEGCFGWHNVAAYYGGRADSATLTLRWVLERLKDVVKPQPQQHSAQSQYHTDFAATATTLMNIWNAVNTSSHQAFTKDQVLDMVDDAFKVMCAKTPPTSPIHPLTTKFTDYITKMVDFYGAHHVKDVGFILDPSTRNSPFWNIHNAVIPLVEELKALSGDERNLVLAQLHNHGRLGEMLRTELVEHFL